MVADPRRALRAATGVLPVALLALACAPAAAPSGPPNLLLVTIDTLRADHVSAYGYGRETTPVLDRVAAEGARVALAYAPTATTGPTHASIFTGRPPIAHRVVKNGLSLHDDERTLAEVLAERGYRCAGLVSSFVLDAKFGYDQGFAHYDAEFDPVTATVRHERKEEGFDRRADETTRRAIAWLRERPTGERPFFLFVHYFDPHHPYDPPREFAERFAPDDPSDATQATVAGYDAEVAFTDHEIGELLGALDDAGLSENTLVVVTADHGEGLMQRGYLGHGIHIYEEAVRVPLVLRWPGRIAAGRVIEGPLQLVDLASTLLDLMGVGEALRASPGRSFAAAVRGEAVPDPSAPVFLHRRHYEKGRYRGEGFGVRQGDWKYIVTERSEELFHLGRDPGEITDLVDEAPEQRDVLAARLMAWRESHAPAAARPALSEEDRAALEALGYAE